MSATNSDRGGLDRAVKTFSIDEDETLQLIATTPDGETRQIGRIHRPGEYALVHSDVLVPSTPRTRPVEYSEDLDIEEFRVLGETVTVGSKGDVGDRTVMLDTDDEGPPVSKFGFAGLYGMFYVPFKK